MELDPVQIRVLGCLLEKEATTPDNYPLSTNALVNACNQASNRNPVVDYTDRDVTAALMELRAEGLVRTVVSGRVDKHKHVLDEAWKLGPGELAVLALLFVRGPQTPGELRGRCERLYSFPTSSEVEQTLEALANRSQALVVKLERQPGQKEARWVQLAGTAEAIDPTLGLVSRGGGSNSRSSGGSPAIAPELVSEVEALRTEVDKLRSDVDRLYELLGEKPA